MTIARERFLKSKIVTAKILEKNQYIINNLEAKHTVLDVGCVGQAIDINSQLWLHKELAEKVKDLTGVDIERSGIEKLKKLGYNVLHVDELSEKNFDVIVMGDIIEHISNLEEFLLFYKKRLKKHGMIIITTPNPFSFRQILNILLFKRPFINIEHTCFLDPYTLIELSQRCGLEIIDFSWIYEHAPAKTITSGIIHSISKIFFKLRKYYSPNFGIILAKAN
jgi:predicted TPR repeat methyltransferase